MMLREEVVARFGRMVNTSADFGKLSDAIAGSGAGYLSQSTLKRLRGYVKDTRRKHRSTLDILSRYIGHADFAAYCNAMDRLNITDSGFATGQVLDAAALEPEEVVEVYWKPDRMMRLRALGEMTFEVADCRNTRVTAGTRVRCMSFVTGQPLMLDICDGAEKMVYIAGKREGIVWQTPSAPGSRDEE